MGAEGAAASNQVGDEEQASLVQMAPSGRFTDPAEVEEEGTQTLDSGGQRPGLKPSPPLAGCVTLGMSHCCPEPSASSSVIWHTTLPGRG